VMFWLCWASCRLWHVSSLYIVTAKDPCRIAL